eukprot:jgi/Psemu1/240781/estExt_Genewise1.C_1940027
MSPQETPELIENSLGELALELEKLPRRCKLIYEKASSMTMSIKIGKNQKGGSEDKVNANGRAGVNNNEHDHLLSLGGTTCSSFCYVKSQKFQLVFLRCESFNARKAATRLVNYLELICEVYGEEALRRPLRVDDIKSREEVEVLSAGHQQLLPFRDKSGRRVLAIHGDLSLPSSSLLSRSVMSRGPATKLVLYLWSVLMEDEDAQRRGLVVVFWPRYVNHRVARRYLEMGEHDAIAKSCDNDSDGNDTNKRQVKCKRKKHRRVADNARDTEENGLRPPDAEVLSLGRKFFEAVPIRICAMHCCLPDTAFFRMVKYIFVYMIGDSYRARVKTHQGHGTEVLYSLMSYGIPVDTLPLDELTQTIKTKNLLAFVNVRRRIEANYHADSNSFGISDDSSYGSSESDDSLKWSSMVECPSLNDVIFRGGKSYMSHPGNMMFRGLIETHIDEHSAASQDRKKSLTWQVIQEVETKGGQFLVYNKGVGTWTKLVDRVQIRHKIANCFKEYRRKIRANQKMQTNHSSTHKFVVQDAKKRRRIRCGMPEDCST